MASIRQQNPQLASMMTPQMMTLMGHPEFVRMALSLAGNNGGGLTGGANPFPGLSGAFGGTPGGGGSGFDPAMIQSILGGGVGGGAGTGGMGLDPAMLQSIMAGMTGGGGGGAAPPPASLGPPEVVYEVQLGQLSGSISLLPPLLLS